MLVINIHDAKTRLSSLIAMAVKGDSFVIAKAGKPLVKVTRIDAPEPSPATRLGFMKGQIAVPEDFDRMVSDDVERLFGGEM